VERAQADEIAAGAFEAHLRADDLDDIGAGAHLFDFILAEPRHPSLLLDEQPNSFELTFQTVRVA
jgi:hypothetical protein